MSTVTRAQLITRSAQRANTSGYADASPGGEISGLVDTSLAKLYNLFAAELYEDFCVKEQVITLQPTVDTYQVASDFMKVRAVFYAQPSASAPTDLSQAARFPMARLERSTLASYGSASGTIGSLPAGYVLEGQTLTVVPRSASALPNFVLLYYIPEYTPAVNDTTPISYAFAYGWDEWVVNDVCVSVRLKSMMPVQELQQERAAYEARVRIQAKNRNAVDPPKIRNTGWKYGGGSSYGNFAFKS